MVDEEIHSLRALSEVLRANRKKAIIASGFSETRRVKQAQKLGAGQYIKKPYTIEKVGVAVKAELESRGSERGDWAHKKQDQAGGRPNV